MDDVGKEMNPELPPFEKGAPEDAELAGNRLVIDGEEALDELKV